MLKLLKVRLSLDQEKLIKKGLFYCIQNLIERLRWILWLPFVHSGVLIHVCSTLISAIKYGLEINLLACLRSIRLLRIKISYWLAPAQVWLLYEYGTDALHHQRYYLCYSRKFMDLGYSSELKSTSEFCRSCKFRYIPTITIPEARVYNSWSGRTGYSGNMGRRNCWKTGF